ncbi:hypothetical protein MN202_08895 [Rheinheimera muenzenbergensis]|uniref:Polar amino acid transport system substrate-binding protein n=1 Tax=Rheinheimera muenzenbergensis TaxID=1193628 RepID=A0ABU8C6Y0_9GAMM
MSKKRKCRIFARLWLASAILGGEAVAAQEQTLRLVLGKLPPFNCVDVTDTPRCINNKLAVKLQHYSGIGITASIVPYARATRMLQQNAADIMLLLQNDELLSYAEPVVSLYSINLSLYVRAAAVQLAHDKIRTGILRGSGSNISAPLAGYRLVELADYDQGVEMLALGRLDAMLGPAEALSFLMQRHDLTGQMAPQPLLQFKQDIWLYCRLNACSPGQIQQLKLAAEQTKPYMPAILQIMPLSYYN